jgi:hypothetical protein
MSKSPVIPSKMTKHVTRTRPTPHKCSPEDTPFAKEENSNQIEWPTKEEYQQLMDDLKAQESETMKILKKVEDDVRSPSFTAGNLYSRIPPTSLYTILPGLFKERPISESKSTRRETWFGCGMPIKGSLLISKKTIVFGLVLSPFSRDN